MNRRLLPVTLSEVFFVFPAALFFAAAFLRVLQPAGHEPARTGGQVFDWFSETGRLGGATMLLVMPALVLVIGTIILIRAWRSDAELRTSTKAVRKALGRYLNVYLLAATTALAGGILFFVVSHIITD
jgi:hypothetical protein